MHEIELSGLDGSNLLGFLAALGTLRVLTLASPEAPVRMSWREQGWWLPVVHHHSIDSADDLLAILAEQVCGPQTINPALEIAEDLVLSRSEFREILTGALTRASAKARQEADFLTALGSEFLGSGTKREQMTDTEFRTMSGAGHQHFLGFMKELAQTTEQDHLRRTLFYAWCYADGRPSLRFDATDYRPHALRAEDPSGDPIRTMRGANRLSVEALPLMPTAPTANSLRTVAFRDENGDTEITWPIWADPVDLYSARSLIGLKEVQQASPVDARARGIAQIFRARRFTDGKYRNFSPARPLL